MGLRKKKGGGGPHPQKRQTYTNQKNYNKRREASYKKNMKNEKKKRFVRTRAYGYCRVTRSDRPKKEPVRKRDCKIKNHKKSKASHVKKKITRERRIAAGKGDRVMHSKRET